MLRLQLQRNANTCKTEPARNHIPGWRHSSSIRFFSLFFFFLDSSFPLHLCTLFLVHFHFSPHLTHIHHTPYYFFAVMEAVWDRDTRVGACFGLFFFFWLGRAFWLYLIA
ncbi:hypothetical protein BDV11DRAFT_121066 [Aspergillus similis]